MKYHDLCLFFSKDINRNRAVIEGMPGNRKRKEIDNMAYDNNLFMEHLRKMIQIPTVSNADPDKMDVDAFLSCMLIWKRHIRWYIRR